MEEIHDANEEAVIYVNGGNEISKDDLHQDNIETRENNTDYDNIKEIIYLDDQKTEIDSTDLVAKENPEKEEIVDLKKEIVNEISKDDLHQDNIETRENKSDYDNIKEIIYLDDQETEIDSTDLVAKENPEKEITAEEIVDLEKEIVMHILENDKEEKDVPDVVFQEHRFRSSSSSSSSSDDSEDVPVLGSDDEDELSRHVNGDIEKKRYVKTHGEFTLEDLPPIEDLQITVDDNIELVEVGSISSIVDVLAIIQAKRDLSPLDIDTILFIEGKKVLGQVFETFGPVVAPLYSVRFNSSSDIVDRQITTGLAVYYAPTMSEWTHYVFVEQLKRLRGSDASWENNNEPPAEHVEYSDDEQERRAKAKRRGKDVGDESEEKDEKNRTKNQQRRRNSQKNSNYSSVTSTSQDAILTSWPPQSPRNFQQAPRKTHQAQRNTHQAPRNTHQAPPPRFSDQRDSVRQPFCVQQSKSSQGPNQALFSVPPPSYQTYPPPPPPPSPHSSLSSPNSFSSPVFSAPKNPPLPPSSGFYSSVSHCLPNYNPSYTVQPASFTAPPSSYQAPPSSFTAPPSSFTAPPSPFTAPPSSYQAPPSSYQAPPSPFTSPPSSFTAPPSSFTAPPSSFTAPPSSYQAPPSSFTAPPASYPAPPSSFFTPPSFNMPPSFTTPPPSFAIPHPFGSPFNSNNAHYPQFGGQPTFHRGPPPPR